MIVKNIFQSPCFYEDVTFLAAESMQKKKHGNCEVQGSLKIGLIQLECSRFFILQCDTVILESIVDILMLEFHAVMS